MLNNKLMCLLLVIPVVFLSLTFFRSDTEIIGHLESLYIALATTTFGIGLLLGAWSQNSKQNHLIASSADDFPSVPNEYIEAAQSARSFPRDNTGHSTRQSK